MPSPLYSRIHTLALHLARCCGDSAQDSASGPDLLSLRTADAVHSWGHKAYVQARNGLLHDMTNDQFATYLAAHVDVIQRASATLHRILIDESERSAVLFMSIFLHVQGCPEPLEQDMIWLMETDVSGTKMRRTVEYVDVVTAKRVAQAFEAVGKHEYGVGGL